MNLDRPEMAAHRLESGCFGTFDEAVVVGSGRIVGVWRAAVGFLLIVGSGSPSSVAYRSSLLFGGFVRLCSRVGLDRWPLVAMMTSLRRIVVYFSCYMLDFGLKCFSYYVFFLQISKNFITINSSYSIK